MAKKRQSVEERMRDLDALDTVGGVAVMDESIAPPPRVRANTDYIDLDPRDIEIIDPVIGNVRFQLDDDEDDIEALAASIQKSPSGEGGPLQAIAVRNIGTPVEPRWALVWGTRRLRAVLKLGLPTITVRNLGIISDTEAAFYQAVENLQRKEVRIVPMALWYAYLTERVSEEYGEVGAQAEVARRLGVHESTVSIYRRIGLALRLLDEDELAEVMRSNAIRAQTLARILASEKDDLQRVARRLLEIARTGNPLPKQPASPPSKRKAGRIEIRANARGGGETIRIRWKDRDAKAEPAAVVTEIAETFKETIERIADRAVALRGVRRRRAEEAARRAQIEAAERALAELQDVARRALDSLQQ